VTLPRLRSSPDRRCKAESERHPRVVPHKATNEACFSSLELQLRLCAKKQGLARGITQRFEFAVLVRASCTMSIRPDLLGRRGRLDLRCGCLGEPNDLIAAVFCCGVYYIVSIFYA
jgi:hypothetical protein